MNKLYEWTKMNNIWTTNSENKQNIKKKLYKIDKTRTKICINKQNISDKLYEKNEKKNKILARIKDNKIDLFRKFNHDKTSKKYFIYIN